MPTPPATVNAPVFVEVAFVVLVSVIGALDTEPRLVMDASVEVFQITTAPNSALTAVSVPAVIVVTPTPPEPRLEVVSTSSPPTKILLPTYKFCPMPAPPCTVKSPVLVFVALVPPASFTAPVLNVP